MEELRDDRSDEREVARRFRFSAPGGPEGGIGPNLLAAWLEGTVSPEEEEAVERALLADPSLLEAVRELRDLAGASPPAVPAEAAARIRRSLARLGAAAGAASPRRAGRIWKLAAAAALTLIAGFLGYRLGQARVEERAAREDTIQSELAGEWAYGFGESAWFSEE
jgi:hypothetical protein